MDDRWTSVPKYVVLATRNDDPETTAVVGPFFEQEGAQAYADRYNAAKTQTNPWTYRVASIQSIGLEPL